MRKIETTYFFRTGWFVFSRPNHEPIKGADTPVPTNERTVCLEHNGNDWALWLGGGAENGGKSPV